MKELKVLGEKLILSENVGGKISLLTINRPKYLNALNSELLSSLFEELRTIEDDKDINCVIITGSGNKAFVAGADIAELKEMNSVQAKQFSLFGHKILNYIENYCKPVIAAINGYTLGGGLELALSCDLRISCDAAKFGLPEVNLGIIPGFGGTQRLPKLVGIGKAKEMIFTGKTIDAYEAEKIGLVNKVVAGDDLIVNTIKFAEEISQKSNIILGQAKESINTGFEEPISTGMVIESSALSVCFSTEDQKEGMQAFLEKRKPKFTNH